MTPARWRRISEIYYAASTVPADERQAFLDRECGSDEDLRREVQSLLEYQSATDDFLRTPAPAESNAAPEPPKLTGARLGSYEIRGLLGVGGMGEVYAAYDPRLERLVAIKVLRGNFSGDDERFRRFEREARAAAALNHPNILAVYDLGTHEGTPYIVMEYVAGDTLHDVLQRGRLPLKRALEIGRDIAAGLAAAHARGIVHRDLKPGNVMVLPDGRAKVLDFGLAKLLTSAAGSHATTAPASLRTEPGRLLGTPAYMSPEQLLGRPSDSRSDIFSLGVILFELVTGRRLFEGDDVMALGMRMLTAAIPMASEVDSSIPAAVCDLIAHSLAREPSARPESADVVRTELERLAVSTDVVSPRPRFTARRVATTLVAVAIVVAAIVTIGRRRDDLPSPAPPAPISVTQGMLVRLGVLPPQNPARRPEFGTWPSLIQSLLATELTGIQGLGVLDPLSMNGRIAQALSAEDAAKLLAGVRASGADWMASTQITPSGDGAEIQLSLVHVASGEARFSARAAATRDAELPGAVRSLAGSIAKYFQLQVLRAAGDKDMAPWISLRDRNIDAVKAFAQAYEYIYRYQINDVQEYLRRAIELDPSFVAPRVWYISALLFRDDLREARRQLAALQALKPAANPFEQAMIGSIAAAVDNDYVTRVHHLEIALKYSPANNILLVNLAQARTVTGDCKRALEDLDVPVKTKWQYPPLYSLWGFCAIQEGRIDEARRVLKASLDAPGVDPNVLGLLEAIELAAGSDEAAMRYAELEAARRRELKRPRGVDVLPVVYERLARYSREHGDESRARILITKAEDLRKQSGPH